MIQVDIRHSLLPEWDELLQINESFEYITDVSRNPIILFQVQDCCDDGMKTVAWAFLRLHDKNNNSFNINRRLRLQLFQVKYLHQVYWL